MTIRIADLSYNVYISSFESGLRFQAAFADMWNADIFVRNMNASYIPEHSKIVLYDGQQGFIYNHFRELVGIANKDKLKELYLFTDDIL